MPTPAGFNYMSLASFDQYIAGNLIEETYSARSDDITRLEGLTRRQRAEKMRDGKD